MKDRYFAHFVGGRGVQRHRLAKYAEAAIALKPPLAIENGQGRKIHGPRLLAVLNRPKNGDTRPCIAAGNCVRHFVGIPEFLLSRRQLPNPSR